MISLPDPPTFPQNGGSPKHYRHAPDAQRRRRLLRLWTFVLVVALFGLVGVGAMRATRQVPAPSSLSSTAWARPPTPASWPPPALPPSSPQSPQSPLTPSSGTRPATLPWLVTPSAAAGHLARPVRPSLREPHARSHPSISPRRSSPALDLSTLAAKVDPGLVDINVQISTPNVQAAGTGIVLDESGVVLTNNHVITGASSINVTDVGNGQSYPATVVGYDSVHDIAVLQLQGASGLPTATLGDSGTVTVGDPIAAIGNAEGRGGTPSIVGGTVSALDQTVTVSDEITGNSEQLTGLIEVAAGIQPGDSGGPLINVAGQVIGIDTAGSASSQSGQSGGDGLAIPINDAIAISKQIQAGTASATVHIGATGVLGVLVTNTSGPSEHGRRAHQQSRTTVPAAPGAAVAGLASGSPAGQAGLVAGDVIVSLDGTTIDSPSALASALTAHHPGDSVQLTWVDTAGQQHTATVVLSPGPPN